MYCIESVEIRQVHPGWYQNEDVIYVAEPDHIPSHNVLVMLVSCYLFGYGTNKVFGTGTPLNKMSVTGCCWYIGIYLTLT